MIRRAGRHPRTMTRLPALSIRSVPPGARLSRSVRVAVDRFERKGRCAHRNVLRPAGLGCAVANPLAGVRNHALACPDLEHAARVFDPHHPVQHHGDFLELRPLSRLAPPLRRDHARDAHGDVARVQAPDELLDLLRFVPGGPEHRWLGNQCWHFPSTDRTPASALMGTPGVWRLRKTRQLRSTKEPWWHDKVPETKQPAVASGAEHHGAGQGSARAPTLDEAGNDAQPTVGEQGDDYRSPPKGESHAEAVRATGLLIVIDRELTARYDEQRPIGGGPPNPKGERGRRRAHVGCAQRRQPIRDVGEHVARSPTLIECDDQRTTEWEWHRLYVVP